MAGAALVRQDADHLRIEGVLDFASVPALWDELRPLIGQAGETELSLAGVDASNSAGLALLVEAVQLARASGHELRLADLPAGLVDLARLSDAGPLLGLDADPAA
jgi:phospholipid transport system transporter-binding protein